MVGEGFIIKYGKGKAHQTVKDPEKGTARDAERGGTSHVKYCQWACN